MSFVCYFDSAMSNVWSSVTRISIRCQQLAEVWNNLNPRASQLNLAHPKTQSNNRCISRHFIKMDSMVLVHQTFIISTTSMAYSSSLDTNKFSHLFVQINWFLFTIPPLHLSSYIPSLLSCAELYKMADFVSIVLAQATIKCGSAMLNKQCNWASTRNGATIDRLQCFRSEIICRRFVFPVE